MVLQFAPHFPSAGIRRFTNSDQPALPMKGIHMDQSAFPRQPSSFPTRRQILGASAAATSGLLFAAASQAAPEGPGGVPGEGPLVQEPAAEPASVSPDRAAVLAAGMTDQEADCWKLAADLAGAFFALPELHPMDSSEVATAVHVIQNKLLSRPTYRAYIAAHKAREAEVREGEAREKK